MKHTALKSSIICLSATLLLLLGTVSMSAQYYQLKVRTDDGLITSFNVESIDSVYFEFEQRTMPVGEAVDLGLSVKWASINVGASKPEDYGNYYAWGETETKTDDYKASTYKYYSDSYKLTKYCNKSSYGNNGITDTKTRLTLEDDVAHVAWGGNWRMPTLAECEELRDNCDWSWVTQNGVKGWKVTSWETSRSIFLPAAGYRFDTGLSRVGSYGYYWSSSLSTGYPDRAWNLIFSSDNHSTDYFQRFCGLSVRPVCK